MQTKKNMLQKSKKYKIKTHFFCLKNIKNIARMFALFFKYGIIFLEHMFDKRR